MRKRTYHLLILAIFSTVVACKQDKEKARDDFRKRQQAMQGEPGNEAQTDELPTEDAPAATSPESSRPADTNAPAPVGDRVVAVKDGDTIELLRNGQTIDVRLYGVDAPEKNQDFGQRSKQFASDLAFNKNVKLIVHNTDRYGRTVGTIILPDGRSLNEEMIRNGYAWHYKAYSKDKNLENLETDARRFKRGLWQDPNPTPPWDFRKDKKVTASEAATAAAEASKTAPIPAGATKRQVYICNSTSVVYHIDKNCSVLKRCKEAVLTVSEASAIREYSRRLDKTCSSK